MENYLLLGVLAASIFLWIWALVDWARARFRNPIMKLWWLVLILILPAAGPLVYFLMGRNFKIRERRKFAPKFRER